MTEKINELQQVEYKDDLILTTEQLAEFYGTTTDSIKKNFQRNTDRFIEGKHYYLLKGTALKAFKSQVTESPLPINKFASSLYLWTKRGASRHAKILDTDKAWDVFDELESNYFDKPVQKFRIPQTYAEALKLASEQQFKIEEQSSQLKEQHPYVEFAVAVGNSKDLISMGSMANILSKNGIDIGRTRLFRWARENHMIKQHSPEPTQWAINSGVIKVQETHNMDKYGHEHLQMTARVTTKGQKYILQKFDIVGGEINLLENN